MRPGRFDAGYRAVAWVLLLVIAAMTLFVFQLVVGEWLVLIFGAVVTLALFKMGFRLWEMKGAIVQLRAQVETLMAASKAPSSGPSHEHGHRDEDQGGPKTG